jgi:vacuolar-type H+-ATPase subunit H
MIEFKTIGTPLVLVIAMMAVTGCDQAEKSAQAMLNQAAESAKQAIDDTNKAAQQALHDANKELSGKKAAPEGEHNKTSQEI